MADAIRCGVIGVGSLGQHHARVYAELESAELVGIYDVDADRANEIASRHDCPVFASSEALAAACDAISVVVPTDRHRDVALPLIEAGTHLLIEKPLCASLAEAEEVVRAAVARGIIIQVGHIEHFNPVTSYLEEHVSSPRYITADRLAPFVIRGTEVGVVLDLMIHDIGIIMSLVRSPIARIEAVGVNVMSQTEDIANARIVFENGCVANINTSRVSLKKVREIRVFQPNAYLSLNFMEQKGHFIRKDGLSLHKEDIPIERDEPLKLELASFVECVRERKDPKVSAAVGKTALEVAIQITDQIRAGMAAMEAAGQ